MGRLAPSPGHGFVQSHTQPRPGFSHHHHHGGHTWYGWSSVSSAGKLILLFTPFLNDFVAASKGLIDAAHFCYLMAQVGLGVYTKKSTKMVLIGSNHRSGPQPQATLLPNCCTCSMRLNLSILVAVCPFTTLPPMKPFKGRRPMSMLSLWAHSRAHCLTSR